LLQANQAMTDELKRMFKIGVSSATATSPASHSASAHVSGAYMSPGMHLHLRLHPAHAHHLSQCCLDASCPCQAPFSLGKLDLFLAVLLSPLAAKEHVSGAYLSSWKSSPSEGH